MTIQVLGETSANVAVHSIGQSAPTLAGASAKSSSLSLTTVLGAIWLTGVTVTGIWTVLQNVRYKKSLHLRSLTHEEAASLAACTAQHKLRLPRAYVSSHIHSPCIIGGLRPTLVLPQAMPLYGKAAGFALLHEACHLRAGDSLWALLRAVLCCLHWFNPLVWLAARLCAIDAELACDMRVMKTLSEKDRFSYARTLVTAAQHQAQTPQEGIGFAKGRLQARIAQILEVKKMKKAWIAVVAVLMVLVFGVSFAVSETTQYEESDWQIPIGIKEGASVYIPISPGSTLHKKTRVSDMDMGENDAFFVTQIRPTYCTVYLNGVKGKMLLTDMIIDPNTINGESAYLYSIDDTGSAIYEAPDVNSRKTMVLLGDFAKVVISEYGDEWCRITLGQNTGYVPTKYIGVGFPNTGNDIGWFW